MSVRYYSSIALETQLTASMSPSSDSIQVAATTGFPPTTPYTLAIDYGAPNEELVEVTAASGLILTVERGFDSTSATSHNPGAAVRHVSSAIDFTESRAHENSDSGIHGLGMSDTIVGTDAAQTLHNKTLDHATGTLENVNIFNEGGWVTSVVSDPTQPTFTQFNVLDNAEDLNPVFEVAGNGSVFINDQGTADANLNVITDDGSSLGSFIKFSNDDGSWGMNHSGTITHLRPSGSTEAWQVWEASGPSIVAAVQSDGSFASFKGVNVWTTSSPTIVPLKIRGDGSQTANLLAITAPNGTTNYVIVTPSGQLQALQGLSVSNGLSANALSVTGTATVGNLVETAPVAWTSYTPVMTDATPNTPVASSNASGFYIQIGKLVHCVGNITAGAVTTTGTAVSLPVVGLRREEGCGIMSNTGTGVATNQSFLARMVTARDRLVLTGLNNAFLNAPNGSSLHWDCTYEVP